MNQFLGNRGNTLNPDGSTPRANYLGYATVRVLGQRMGRFVEFEYSLNDDDLAVELVLPLKAFEEFCITQKATIITNEDNSAEEVLWRLKNPGLLKKVNNN